MLLSFKLHFPLDYSLAYLFEIDPLLFRCAKKKFSGSTSLLNIENKDSLTILANSNKRLGHASNCCHLVVTYVDYIISRPDK